MSGKWHLGVADKPQNEFKYWYSHQKGGGPYYGAPMYKDGELVKLPGRSFASLLKGEKLERDDEDKKDIVKELRYRLKKWFIQYVNPEIDGAKLPVFGGGQAGLWGKDEATFKRYDSDFIFSCDGKLKND